MATDASLDRLRAARETWRAADEAVAEYGETTLERVAEAVEQFDQLTARYEESATGTGDFRAFVTFQEKVEELVADLPDDLPGRDAFETADDRLQQRRLSESDFAAARDALDTPRTLAERLDERADARREVSEARRAVNERIDTLDERIAELERVRRFADADVDAPTERLREPIERYDDRARETFDAFRRTVSAREVLTVVDETRHFPLVPFERPPDELLSYLRDAPVGDEPIPTLLAYDDYSRSKLAHYVDDPGQFQARIAVHRTYLDRLSADPLLVGWPPPAAGALRARADELASVVGRVRRRIDDLPAATTTGADTADSNEADAVALARRLHRLPKETAYERLREAALAETELTPDQRERLRSGEVSAELDQLRSERTRLADALDERVV